MSTTVKPVVLVILDGWGCSETEANNAIRMATTPIWDRLLNEYPNTLISTSGPAVGLPAGQMGNSEVGHLNLGAGRVVYQEFTRVSRSVKTGSFYDNLTLVEAVDGAIRNDKAVHIMGLLSPGGVHSHETHIHAMAKLAVERGAERVFIHAFLDGRDTPPKSAESSLQMLQDVLDGLGGGRIASIVGRYYAMDRDNRWERVEQAYDMLTQGHAEFAAPDPKSALFAAYDRGESDEFVKPTAIMPPGSLPVKIDDGDTVIFMNYRSDRARELTRIFIEPAFDGFKRVMTPALGSFVTLTQYNEAFDVPVAFLPERLNNVFGEFISSLGLRQLRLAETEKYAHVTFFFNGGREEAFEGEQRILVPSPKVPTYDEQPEMSAPEVTDYLVEAVQSQDYDTIICNYANADMVGHTGDLDAAIQAVEVLDECLGRVLSALHRAGGEMLVTADHGNVEQMRDDGNDQAHTAHTTNRVPLVYVGREATLAENGGLCDIAPSLLGLMGIEPPPEMRGHNLVEFVQNKE
ncbi:MAG: 2,3-bisphosphoglycerate-independent phosphoglycerate mutase [Gammaproteobacteria bacterium]|nr:2,3-bisphosphoglycerate-independent phosphoglycerate mutase [Gammaproteobacteria bacterium]